MTALLVSAVAALSATCFGLVIQLVELRASLKKSSDDAESFKVKVAELEQEKDIAVPRLNEHKGNASKQRPQYAEREVFGRVKELYKLRSKAVHGGRMKGNANEGVDESALLLRTLIRRCAELGSMPNIESLVP